MKDTREIKREAPAALLSARGVATLALSALLMAGAASCKKDKEAASQAEGTVCFKATVEAHSGNDKTHLDNKQVLWNEDDIVAVYNGSGALGRLKATGLSNGDKSAVLVDPTNAFTLTPPYKAVYPCPSSQENVTGNVISGLQLHPDGRQAYSVSGFARDVNPMAAYAGEGSTLSFINLCGLLKVSLKGSCTVDHITIRSNNTDDVLWGDCSVNIDPTGGNHSIAVTNDGNNNKHILTMECNNTQLDENNATDFYFVLPPDRLASGFTMEVFEKVEFKNVGEKDIAVIRQSVSSGTKIERSRIVSMKEIAIGEDLSVYDGGHETANCYIAAERGHSYRFPCTIKGNGVAPTGTVAGVLAGSEWLDYEITGYRTASRVWETFNNGTKPNGGDVVESAIISGDYVHFTTGTHEGNALIGVCDEEGNILWSWHIWCVDDYEPANPAKDYTAFGLLDGHGPLMDRNLGALSNGMNDDDRALSAGLMYQWGRKDPLFGAANYMTQNTNDQVFMASTLDAPAGQGVSDTIKAKNDGKANLQRATRQPWRFVGHGGNTISYDWFDDTPAHSDGLWATAKTMYDPCPHGWRVAEIGTFKQNGSLDTDNLTWGKYDGTANDNWGDFDSSNKGRVFTDGNSGESFYPASGYRSGSGRLDYVQTGGYAWSCSPYDDSSHTLYAYYLDIHSSRVLPFNNTNRSYGFHVRPVQESSSSSLK